MAQVADVDLFRAGGSQCVQGLPQDLFGRGTRVEFTSQLLCRYREELPQSCERSGLGTPVVEDAEYSRGGDVAAIALLELSTDGRSLTIEGFDRTECAGGLGFGVRARTFDR